MPKREAWKQLNPRDQSRSIMMAVDGWIEILWMNHEKLDKLRAYDCLLGHLEELKELHEYLPLEW